MSEFSNRFRQLKEESNLTLKDLSEELGISVPNLSYYMKGREPSYDILINITNYFNVTTDWLIGRTDARSSVYAALDEEITNTIIKNDVKNISKEDVTALSIYKDDYLKTQEKLIELLSFYYTILHKLEELQKLRPKLDYSSMNDSLTYNFIEALEYQIDILVDAQSVISASTSPLFFEYYFNSLLRIDLVSNRYKMVLANIIKIANSNFDENNDQKSVITDFISQIENYGHNCISDIELSTYLNKIGIWFPHKMHILW